ncbi:type I phosphomannose isomerase catalytic subunit [Rohdeia mirabilis]|uniref:type I phosphomannose isomerase catalytic subunit n=1 Tax=Rohdeia mirabilis TaxID=2528008 RepID=UPI003AF3CCAC
MTPTPEHSHAGSSDRASSDDVELAAHLAREPLRFGRLCLEKVWGGRALEDVLGIELEGDGPIGETWELVDRTDHQSVVRGGPLAGTTLGELVARAPRALLGNAPTARNGRFPLLVKFLDASAPLSVQVHPDDAGAAAQGHGSEAKTEAWYFLRDGGEVWCGFEPGVDRAAFETALAAGHASKPLARHPVRGGDALTVLGGTVHAIGAGVTLLEVQQNSDTTYRLDDWGRLGLDGKPRDLHLAQGLEVTRFGVPAPRTSSPARPRPGARTPATQLLASTEHFELEAIDLASSPPALTLDTGGRFQIYVVVAGPNRDHSGIVVARESEPAGSGVRLALGESVLVPAALGRHRIERLPGPDGSSAPDPVRLVRLACPAR